MKTKVKIKKIKKFRCPACDFEKIRGVLVQTDFGYVFKTCQSRECILYVSRHAVKL